MISPEKTCHFYNISHLDLSLAPLIVNSVYCMVTYVAENRIKKQALTKGHFSKKLPSSHKLLI